MEYTALTLAICCIVLIKWLFKLKKQTGEDSRKLRERYIDEVNFNQKLKQSLSEARKDCLVSELKCAALEKQIEELKKQKKMLEQLDNEIMRDMATANEELINEKKELENLNGRLNSGLRKALAQLEIYQRPEVHSFATLAEVG